MHYPISQQQHVGELGAQQTAHTAHDGVEHGLRIRHRGADRGQDLSRRCLLLKRLGQLARTRLHLFEKARVLDGDDGLVGECF